MTDTKPILILGGTGKTGRRLAERLTAQGVPVRIGSRSGSPRFDWEVPATWSPAMQGVSAVYISYYPDIAVPGTARIKVFSESSVPRPGIVERPRIQAIASSGDGLASCSVLWCSAIQKR